MRFLCPPPSTPLNLKMGGARTPLSQTMPASMRFSAYTWDFNIPLYLSISPLSS